MNIAFIPARGGSKSIPLKNIKELNGKPLIYWTLKAANDAKCIDKVILATDNEEIKAVGKSFNFSKLEIYNRSSENAQDTSPTESVMLEFLNHNQYDTNDYFFLIQATSPLLTSENIDEMFKKLIASDADSIFSGVTEKRFYWTEQNNQLTPINYDYKNRPRRQDYKGMILENGACYINTTGNILKDKNRLSGKITYYELPPKTAFEIDEPIDWTIIEHLMTN